MSETNSRNLRKIIAAAAIVVAVALVLFGVSRAQAEQGSQAGQYTWEDVEELENTDIFKGDTLEHLFDGETGVDDKGNTIALGYHYDGVSDSRGEIIVGTRSEPDENGVYTARVTVDGFRKIGNSGYSTFFPDSMSPQDVVDAINEAYDDRELQYGRVYEGVSDEGLTIRMYLNYSNKVISAYPIMQGY